MSSYQQTNMLHSLCQSERSKRTQTQATSVFAQHQAASPKEALENISNPVLTLEEFAT
jgi:hypothetical protein